MKYIKVLFITLLGSSCSFNVNLQRLPPPQQIEEKAKIENSFGELAKSINALHERIKNLEKTLHKE